jgi:hypothetical protein
VLDAADGTHLGKDVLDGSELGTQVLVLLLAELLPGNLLAKGLVKPVGETPASL